VYVWLIFISLAACAICLMGCGAVRGAARFGEGLGGDIACLSGMAADNIVLDSDKPKVKGMTTDDLFRRGK